MKFTKFGKALLMSALSAGVVISLTSCNQSYTVGYLYVTGTTTASTTGTGYIAGFNIDHNTGKLTALRGLPIASGGSNPIRAVMADSGRFLYVLNQGASADGKPCTASDPCLNSNITPFVVGGNGILTSMGVAYYSQGINPIRMIVDGSGSYLYVLDHDSSISTKPDTYCTSALGNDSTGAPITACGDVTIFKILSTGRLSLLQNSQVSTAAGLQLTYFPVPANPIDFVDSGSLFTLSSPPATKTALATGAEVFPYSFVSATGQLTVNPVQVLTDSNNANTLVNAATAIVAAGGHVYVLDNEAPSSNSTSANAQILPYNVSGTVLSPMVGGVVLEPAQVSDPVALLIEAKGKFLYVANQGNLTDTTNASSAIAGYVIDPATSELSLNGGEPYGAGFGPKCMVEDPSSQFIYEADYGDSMVWGRQVDPNNGQLKQLNTNSSYSLSGPATWCLVDGRTN